MVDDLDGVWVLGRRKPDEPVADPFEDLCPVGFCAAKPLAQGSEDLRVGAIVLLLVVPECVQLHSSDGIVGEEAFEVGRLIRVRARHAYEAAPSVRGVALGSSWIAGSVGGTPRGPGWASEPAPVVRTVIAIAVPMAIFNDAALRLFQNMDLSTCWASTDAVAEAGPALARRGGSQSAPQPR